MSKKDHILMTGIEISRDGIFVLISQRIDGEHAVIRLSGEDAHQLSKKLDVLSSDVARKCEWYSQDDYK